MSSQDDFGQVTCTGRPRAADREFWLYFVRFFASKVVRMSPDNPQDSFGPSFRPNGRFSTHFGLNLMFLALTGTLVSQDWTWAEAWIDLGLGPTSDDLGLRLGRILDQPWANFGTALGRNLV